MKLLHLCVVAVLLTVVLGLPAAAQDGGTVTYAVAASDLYTVTNNGTADALIMFTDCLTANRTYTLDFAVTVVTDQSITTTLATVGEGSFNFIPQGFTPSTIQTSGTDPQTFNVRGTFRAGNSVFPPRQPPEVVGIYLQGPSDSVLGDAILVVRFACVAASTQVFLPVITTTPPPTAALRGTLAYIRDGTIYGYNLRTKQTRVLITNGRDMQFSPDGTRLAFVRDDGLYLARADGTNIRRIAAQTGVQHPRWSDDSTKLLWTRATNDIWTVTVPSGTPAKIATGFDPAWAPDSVRLTYVAGRQLRVVNWQGQNEWAVVTSIPPTTPPIGLPGEEVPPEQLDHSMFTPVWNAAGTAIYLPANVWYCCETQVAIWERADTTTGGSMFLDTLVDVVDVLGAPNRQAALVVSVGGGSALTTISPRSLDPTVPDVTYAWAALEPRRGDPFVVSIVPTWAPDSNAIAVLRCGGSTCDLVAQAPGHAAPTVLVPDLPGQLDLSLAWGRGD